MKDCLETRIARSLKNSLEYKFPGIKSDCQAEGDTIAYLLSMLDMVIDNDGNHPEHKLNRWIGFVQGVLVARKISTIPVERERVGTILKQYITPVTPNPYMGTMAPPKREELTYIAREIVPEISDDELRQARKG